MDWKQIGLKEFWLWIYHHSPCIDPPDHLSTARGMLVEACLQRRNESLLPGGCFTMELLETTKFKPEQSIQKRWNWMQPRCNYAIPYHAYSSSSSWLNVLVYIQKSLICLLILVIIICHLSNTSDTGHVWHIFPSTLTWKTGNHYSNPPFSSSSACNSICALFFLSKCLRLVFNPGGPREGFSRCFKNRCDRRILGRISTSGSATACQAPAFCDIICV